MTLNSGSPDYTPRHAGLVEGTTPVEDQKPPALVFSNSTYEGLRALAEVILPGVAAFYVALAGVWGFGFVAQVVGTIAAVETLLGLVIRLARRTYNQSDAKFDGTVNVQQDGENPKTLQLDLLAAPETLQSQKEVVLKVTQS